MKTGAEAARPQSRTLTVYTFDGLEPAAQRRAIACTKDYVEGGVRHTTEHTLTREILPQLLESHSLLDIGEAARADASFATGTRQAWFEGHMLWKYKGELYHVHVVRGLVLDLLGMSEDKSFIEFTSGLKLKVQKRIKTAGRDEWTGIDKDAEKAFVEVFEDICKALTEKAREIYDAGVSDDRLTAMLRESRFSFLRDGKSLQDL